METWYSAVSWTGFLVLFGGLGIYYYGQQKPQPARRQSMQEHREPRQKVKKREHERPSADSNAAEATNGKENAKRRKVQSYPPPPQQAAPTVVVQNDNDDKEDLSTRQFAEQLAKARKGTDLSAPKSKEQRLKTVKQGSAKSSPLQTTEPGADADDDLSPAASPALNAGDVSDMLEPKTSGPSTLRLTAPAQPQKEKVARKKKEEPVESKKQRQNRQKKEREREDREAEEKERKLREEKQRRAAREARGEPAKNGIPVSKPPASNAWANKPAPAGNENAAPAVNGSALLDTFDAESTASSNGGNEPSTAATSTTDAETIQQRGRDELSEEEQMAKAMKESGDESGWTTVAQPKKQKGKKTDGETNGVSTPVEPAPTPKPAPVTKPAPANKPVVNGKPKGFQALKDEYEQRTDVDPNDASNWDA